MREEMIPATQAIAALRRIDERSRLLIRLDSEAALLSGELRRMDGLQRTLDYRTMRSPDALFLRAEWHRRNRRDVDACRTLNRILALDASWAPAVAMRSVVRGRLGDRRGAWIDAEVVSRLGRPEWGIPSAALADVAAADTARAKERLRSVVPPKRNGAASYLESLLKGAALLSIENPVRARSYLEATICEDPYRRLLSGDPLLAGSPPVTACRVSASVNSSVGGS
jgi:hypothetical protein